MGISDFTRHRFFFKPNLKFKIHDSAFKLKDSPRTTAVESHADTYSTCLELDKIDLTGVDPVNFNTIGSDSRGLIV